MCRPLPQGKAFVNRLVEYAKCGETAVAGAATDAHLAVSDSKSEFKSVY
jgi:hypothetical protein